MSEQYARYTDALYVEKCNELMDELPDFCKTYYQGMQLRLASRSQYNYLVKMKVFLTYLTESGICKGKKIKDIDLSDINKLKVSDMESFITWLLQRPSRYKGLKNSKSTAENYISSLSSVFTYFVSREMLDKNPTRGLVREKKKKKKIIYLEKDDMNTLLDTTWEGVDLSKKQQEFRDKGNTAIRDGCIMQILLDTGIRVAELVGLDVEDVDLKHSKLNIHRKGDKDEYVSFSDATSEIITGYLEERNSFMPVDNERALFLVSIGKYKGERMSIRSIERLEKKYCMASGVKDSGKMSPHKMRSTYAMNMLDASGNIALVKEQLGHNSIMTTTTYAEARQKVKEDYRNAIFSQGDKK